MNRPGKIAKIISLVLCVVIFAFTLCSCGKKGVAMTYTVDGKEYTLSEREYDFLMKYRKYEIFYSYYYSYKIDTAAFWSQKSEGETQTLDEIITDTVKKTAKTMLVEQYLMDKYALTLKDEDIEKARTDAKTAAKNYGGAGAFKKYWGYTSDDYFNYQLAVLRSTAVYEYLYNDENGIAKLTDEQLEEYYKENYKQYQFILINTEQKIVTDEDGNKKYLVYDKNNNSLYVTDISEEYLKENEYTLGYSYQYEDITDDDEKAKKANLADELIAQLKGGADFAELAKANSDNFYSSYFPNGLIVSGDLVDDDAVRKALEDLEVGSYTDAISINSGKYVYIIKRVELKDKAYEDAYEDAEDTEYKELFEDYSDTVKNFKYNELLEEYAATVVLDSSVVDKYTMANTYLSQAIRDRENSYS